MGSVLYFGDRLNDTAKCSFQAVHSCYEWVVFAINFENKHFVAEVKSIVVESQTDIGSSGTIVLLTAFGGIATLASPSALGKVVS